MRLGLGLNLTLTLKVGLREGAYQLPLILGYPGVGKGAHRLDDGRLTEAGLNARPRVPCATVLVRLLPADTPAGSPPSYAARAYDTRLATPQAHEVVLYRLRLQRSPLAAVEGIRRAAQGAGQAPPAADDSERWLRAHLGDQRYTAGLPLDMNGFAAYNPVAGVQLAAYAATGLRENLLSMAAISLFPPGNLYRSSANATGVRLSDGYEWDSEVRNPRWQQGATHFPQVPLDPSTLIVVDVRALEKPGRPALRAQGWSVLPLFMGDQVNSGVFQLPLYQGTPPLALLQQVARRGQEVLEAALSRKQLKRVEWGSVCLGVLDAQRFGEWDAPHARPEPNTALLLPKKLKQYLKPPTSKPISTLVPADSNRDDFLAMSVAAFAEGVKNLGGS